MLNFFLRQAFSGEIIEKNLSAKLQDSVADDAYASTKKISKFKASKLNKE